MRVRERASERACKRVCERAVTACVCASVHSARAGVHNARARTAHRCAQRAGVHSVCACTACVHAQHVSVHQTRERERNLFTYIYTYKTTLRVIRRIGGGKNGEGG